MEWIVYVTHELAAEPIGKRERYVLVVGREDELALFVGAIFGAFKLCCIGQIPRPYWGKSPRFRGNNVCGLQNSLRGKYLFALGGGSL